MKSLMKTNRQRTCDAAFPFRMGAGFAGDVNRSHPVEIEPGINDTTNPALNYGVPLLVNASANTLRQFIASDQSNSAIVIPYGFVVRPYPFQSPTAGSFGSASFGNTAPPAGGNVIDAVRSGMLISQIPPGVTVAKGGTVWVWCAASTGNHVQGGLEGAASSGNTVQLDPRYMFNGPADANGIVEVSVNV